MVETAKSSQSTSITGSSALFVTEHILWCRFTQNARLCGIAGIPHSDGKQAITQFLVSDSSAHSPGMRYVNACIHCPANHW